MKNKELFEKTVNILVKAYQNDQLRHSDCTACVVGNLCGGRSRWGLVFYSHPGGQDFNIENYYGEAKRLIDSTGYSLKELMKIENTFETCEFSENEDIHMFNGLMAVIDCLMIIHEANLEQANFAKSLFIKETV